MTLLSESITSTNKLKDYNKDLPLYFTTRSCLVEERKFYTNGKIVKTDSGYYDLKFNFIDLLQKHL